ncbi:hypothetical protein AGLY_002816 [Aphis glycines]|uniref:Uncharacterized protein n=1 Tax=Aphis glycines TaxID=307491 RepID=A0A6G0U1D1_APHGL|nr:hypothetical protein AGLY_002816 [Aphis glycines]
MRGSYSFSVKVRPFRIAQGRAFNWTEGGNHDHLSTGCTTAVNPRATRHFQILEKKTQYQHNFITDKAVINTIKKYCEYESFYNNLKYIKFESNDRYHFIRKLILNEDDQARIYFLMDGEKGGLFFNGLNTLKCKFFITIIKLNLWKNLFKNIYDFDNFLSIFEIQMLIKIIVAICILIIFESLWN